MNFGSTSSKYAIYENDAEIRGQNYDYSHIENFHQFGNKEQSAVREESLFSFLESAGYQLNDMAAIAARGGITPPLKTGAYRVNELMVDRLSNRPLRPHASNLCAVVAYHLAHPLRIPVFVYDTLAVDQMDDVARYTGIPEIKRPSLGHIENFRAIAFKVAKKLGRRYEDLNLVMAHIGGGTTVSAHCKGRITDILETSEGPMSTQRSGSISSTMLADLIYSGKYTEQQMRKMLRGQGGMYAYLGTTDAREVESRILRGDNQAKTIYYAMAYQVAKAIGAYAAVTKGNVDQIILTGGIAHSKIFTQWIIERVQWIAPVSIYAGEYEMEAMACGVYRVLSGMEAALEYTE
jgi:butyrate kinase